MRRARHAPRASLTAPVPGCRRLVAEEGDGRERPTRGADASFSSLHCDAHHFASERSPPPPRFLRALNPLNPRLPDKADGRGEKIARGFADHDDRRVSGLSGMDKSAPSASVNLQIETRSLGKVKKQMAVRWDERRGEPKQMD